jgi:hypothetical protein
MSFDEYARGIVPEYPKGRSSWREIQILGSLGGARRIASEKSNEQLAFAFLATLCPSGEEPCIISDGTTR